MKKFEVTITETLKKKVEVEAETQEDAEQIVTDDWYKGEHILDSNNFSEVVFEAKEYEPEKIKVVLLEPGKVARAAEIDATLEGMQSVVGGLIQPGYYFEEPVCCVVNEEGKMIGLDLNRGVYDGNKQLIDIIAGTAFICDCSGENFGSLTEEQIKKYSKQFKYPERFFKINDQIRGIAYVSDQKTDLDKFLRIQLICTQIVLFGDQHSRKLQLSMLSELVGIMARTNEVNAYTSLAGLVIISQKTEVIYELLNEILYINQVEKIKQIKNSLLFSTNIDLAISIGYFLKNNYLIEQLINGFPNNDTYPFINMINEHILPDKDLKLLFKEFEGLYVNEMGRRHNTNCQKLLTEHSTEYNDFEKRCNQVINDMNRLCLYGHTHDFKYAYQLKDNGGDYCKKMVCVPAPTVRLAAASRTEDASRGFNIIEMQKSDGKYKKIVIKNFEIKKASISKVSQDEFEL